MAFDSAGALEMTVEVDLSKTTFLVVDDKAFYRDMAHTALTRAKAKNIEHAVDVEKAEQIIKRLGRRIGCVICDWDMAPAGGLNLLQMIRSGKLVRLPPDTPFVILTGQPNSSAIKAAMVMDVTGVAIAPLSLEKLVKIIASAIAREWTLKSKEHYAAVQLIQSTKTAPPPGSQPKSTQPRAGILKTGATTSPSGAHGTPTNAPHCSSHSARVPDEPELVMVRMSNLARVGPGDIIARDLKDKDGRMLVSVGTELTASLIERLKEHSNGHPDSYHLWVGEWDKSPA